MSTKDVSPPRSKRKLSKAQKTASTSTSRPTQTNRSSRDINRVRRGTSPYQVERHLRGSPQSKKYVQSLGRGIHVLECLNLNNGSNVNTLARITGINRAIVYRLAETLVMLGLVERDAQTGCYWLSSAVTGLSGGFFCESWIDSEARGLIEDLGRSVLWPVSLTVPSGLSMVLRCCTDQLSPFTLRKMPLGFRVSIAGTASGRVFLANLSATKREQLLDAIRKASPFEEDTVASDRALFSEMIASARRLGYATQELPHITSLAVPVVRDGEPIGALCLRYYSSALKPSLAIKRYLGALCRTAEQLTLARSNVGNAQHE